MEQHEEELQEFYFNPELNLQPEEIAYLASVYGQPGFKVIAKILRKGVDWFIKNLVNANASKTEEVVTAQIKSQVAAQMYTLWLNQINELVVQYVHSQPTDKPVESVQGLDFGETHIDDGGETIL
jgi:hypothetical protein